MNFLRNLRNSLKNNFSTVIYSVVIAIIAWFVISMIMYPSVTQTIENIPVDLDISGTVAADNDLSVISSSVTSVDVRIKGTRTQIGNISNENLKAVLVMDNVTSTGTKTIFLKIVCTDSSINFEVASIYPETATVVLDKYETREYSIFPEIPNVTFADGKTISNDEYSCDPSTIQITGPSAQLDMISECIAVSNKELHLDSSYSVISDEIKLYAEDGTTIDQTNLKFDTTSFNINIPVLTVKTVDLSVGIAYAPSTFNSDFLQFTLSEDSITLASKTSQLSEFPDTFEIGKIVLSDLCIDYTKMFIIDTGNYKNMSNLEMVTVMLDSSNLAERHFVITNFNVTNAPENYDFTVVTNSLEIDVIGPEDVVNELTLSDIVADINLLNADMTYEGETFNWDVTISFPNYDNVWAVTQSKAIVSKKEKATETSDSDDENTTDSEESETTTESE